MANYDQVFRSICIEMRAIYFCEDEQLESKNQLGSPYLSIYFPESIVLRT